MKIHENISKSVKRSTCIWIIIDALKLTKTHATYNSIWFANDKGFDCIIKSACYDALPPVFLGMCLTPLMPFLIVWVVCKTWFHIRQSKIMRERAIEPLCE